MANRSYTTSKRQANTNQELKCKIFLQETSRQDLHLVFTIIMCSHTSLSPLEILVHSHVCYPKSKSRLSYAKLSHPEASTLTNYMEGRKRRRIRLIPSIRTQARTFYRTYQVVPSMSSASCLLHTKTRGRVSPAL